MCKCKKNNRKANFLFFNNSNVLLLQYKDIHVNGKALSIIT